MHAPDELMGPREQRRAATTIDGGVLRITAPTKPEGGIVGELLRALEEHARVRVTDGPLRVSVDVRHAPFAPSGQEIRLGAMRMGAWGKRGRIALLVDGDFQYGLVRMLGLLAEGSGLDVEPFRDASEADRWLHSVEQSRGL